MKNIKITHVSATSFLTLYCHGLENKRGNPLLIDPKSLEIMEKLNEKLKDSEDQLYRKLISGKVQKGLIEFICLRAKKFDDWGRKYLKNTPDGVVVNMGCGMDPRFFRIDNGKANFYDLDFPEIIEIKEQFLEKNDRYHFIASSLLDYRWMEELIKYNKAPLFMAEGVFMYLQEEDVKSLVLELQKKFPGSELVCEVFNKFWLKKPWKSLLDFKMRKSFSIGEDATFHFGLKDSRDMEEWGDGIEFLDDWSYFDIEKEKLGWFGLLRNIDFFRKIQWVVHYRLV